MNSEEANEGMEAVLDRLYEKGIDLPTLVTEFVITFHDACSYELERTVKVCLVLFTDYLFGTDSIFLCAKHPDFVQIYRLDSNVNI